MGEELYGSRRRSPRVPCSLKGLFFSKDNFSRRIECLDISAHGARVSANEPLAVDSYAGLSLEARAYDVITALGKVCWCKKIGESWHAGIAFNREMAQPLEKVV
ncbi:MAG: PilZ domain-containing protein [Candidatus Omnitrophota bacterium]|nr:PilZ domain-containing protein [Candidatus Omnitrophota bacterium]